MGINIRKMKVSFFEYKRHIFGERKMTRLSDLIIQRSLQNATNY